MASSFNNQGLLLGIAVAAGRENDERISAGIQASQFQPGSPALLGAVLMKKQFDRVADLESQLTSAKHERDRLKATGAASSPSGQLAPTPPPPPPPPGSGLSAGSSTSSGSGQPVATPQSLQDASLAFMAVALSNLQNETAALKDAIANNGSKAFDQARSMTMLPTLPSYSTPAVHAKYVTAYNQAITALLNSLKTNFISAFSLNYPAPPGGTSQPGPMLANQQDESTA